MSLAVSTQTPPVGTKLVKESDAKSTPDNSVTGAAGAVYLIEVDNAANLADAAFFKIYDLAAPDPYVDYPDFVMKVMAGQRRAVAIPLGWDFTDLSFCVSSSAAKSVAGSTDMPNPVEVSIVTT